MTSFCSLELYFTVLFIHKIEPSNFDKQYHVPRFKLYLPHTPRFPLALKIKTIVSDANNTSWRWWDRGVVKGDETFEVPGFVL